MNYAEVRGGRWISMVTVEYASELDPLLELSLPPDWLVAVVPEPGQLLADSNLPEDRLLGQLLSGGDGHRIVASRMAFLYYRGIDPDPVVDHLKLHEIAIVERFGLDHPAVAVDDQNGIERR